MAEPITPATFGPMACRVLLLTDRLRNARRHRNGGNAGRADKRIYLVLLCEQVHKLCKQNAARSTECESHYSHAEYFNGLHIEERLCRCGSAY